MYLMDIEGKKSITIYKEWERFVRRHELEYIKLFLKNYSLKNRIENPKILEIGSGNGYIASILQDEGWIVIPTDPSPRIPMLTRVYPMSVECLKYHDSFFDIIFSTCVLEHIEDLVEALKEMKRMLKKDGIMIHVVPTSFSGIITFIVSPIAYLKTIPLVVLRQKPLKRINPVFCLWGHGTSKSIYHTFFDWKWKKWKKIYKKNGLDIVYQRRVDLIYSMHKVFPFKFIKSRRFLGNFFGSSDVYILKKD